MAWSEMLATSTVCLTTTLPILTGTIMPAEQSSGVPSASLRDKRETSIVASLLFLSEIWWEMSLEIMVRLDPVSTKQLTSKSKIEIST